MQFRYPLPARLVEQAVSLDEFANGGTQCHVRLRDGTIHRDVLISNSTAIVAMRGHANLPFAVDDIELLFQADDDRSPAKQVEWQFFDVWQN